MPKSYNQVIYTTKYHAHLSTIHILWLSCSTFHTIMMETEHIDKEPKTRSVMLYPLGKFLLFI